jgi:hypothetical protein
MTADSLQGLPAVSIVVKGQNRGTISNDRGVFSIVVLKGDKIEFTSVGFKTGPCEYSPKPGRKPAQCYTVNGG